MGLEVSQGPESVGSTLAALERATASTRRTLDAAGRVVLVGTGASMEMARAVAPAWRTAGAARGDHRPIVLREASAVVFDTDGEILRPDDVVVVVSYRGTSPETVAAAVVAGRAGCTVLAVTRTAPSPLTEAVREVIAIRCDPDEQGAATKSELATLAALLAMGGVLSPGDPDRTALVGMLQDVVSDWSNAAAVGPVFETARQVWFLGFGADLGLARAGCLLWNEKVRRSAVAFTPSGFRHGPIEAVRPGDAVVIIDGRTTPTAHHESYLERLEVELAGLGASTIWISPTPPNQGILLSITAGGPGVASLEALLRVQQLARAAAHAMGTYREGFEVLGKTVLPSSPLV